MSLANALSRRPARCRAARPIDQPRGPSEAAGRLSVTPPPEGGPSMRATRWQPFNPIWNQLQQLQEDMNRVFERWSEDGGRLLGRSAYPPVNVWEDAENIYVEAELPGLSLNDLEIYVTGNQLTLKGERRQPVPEKAVWHRQERGFGPFSRTLTLPFDVDADKVDARFENGVLTVKLAKHESARPRKIAVKGE